MPGRRQPQVISIQRLALGLLVLPLPAVDAALSLAATLTRPKLSFAAPKRAGFHVAKGATRCINLHASALAAEVVSPHQFKQRSSHRKNAASDMRTVLFVRDPVDLAVSHFLHARNASTEDDDTLPGTAREVQEEVSKILKANVTDWMEVGRRETYQNWLLRADLPHAFKAHLAHLQPEIVKLEDAIYECSRLPTALCQQVPYDSLRKNDEAYMTFWAQLFSFAGTDLNSAKEARLKDCLARQAPSVYQAEAKNATPNPTSRLRPRRAGLHQGRLLTAQDVAQLAQVATSIDRDVFGGRFARVRRCVATTI